MPYRRWARRAVLALSVLVSGFKPTLTQTAPASALLSGVVMDPSGARVTRAKIHVQSPYFARDLTSDSAGRFGTDIPAGAYDISVTSPGFEHYEKRAVSIPAGQHLELPVFLTIPIREEEVLVPSDTSASTDPEANLGALVFKGSQLAIFSDDEELFARQLAAITGSGDPDLSQIYVDGFSGGRVPPKTAIREIRINQNPFSAQYDRQGLTRIDILTKPGTDKLHGDISFSFNNQALNAQNPFIVGTEPPYHTTIVDGSVNGPLGKKTSFFISGNNADRENNAVVNALVPNANGNPYTLSEAVPNPQVANTYSARLDHQFTSTNTLSARYEYHGLNIKNAGLGPLTLPSEAYDSSLTTNTLQLSDTQAISPKLVSETRFQYIRSRNRQTPLDNSTALLVQGAFNGGGSPTQVYSDNQDHYEFQQYFSLDHGAHFFRMGARYRVLRDANLSTANYNGIYTFPNLSAYQNATPSQFNTTVGQPSAAILTGDLGAYVEDTWRIRKNLTLNLGFRLESQFAIPDHFDPAPRLSLSWAISRAKSKTPLVVLRPGFAMFYDRFAASNILNAVRQNGTTEQAFFVQDPRYCNPITPQCNPAASTVAQQPTIYRIDPNLDSQYDIVAAISAEHSFGRHGSISSTYSIYRGVHQFLSRNINAPLPGTYDPSQPGSGVRPFGGAQNIYQYSADGNSHVQLFSTTFNYLPTRRIFLTGLYAAQRNLTDSSGAAAFVSNSYDLHADYGRSGLVAAQRLFTGGQWNMPYGFSLSSFVNYHSGLPFNITTGSDNNGDTIYNDRPAFATDVTRSSVINTQLGSFDVSPLPSQRIVPINFGNSPAYVSWNTYFDTSIKLGPKHVLPAPRQAGAANGAAKQAVERPFMLGLAAEVENLLNHVNPGTPIGVLSSCYSNSVAAGPTSCSSATSLFGRSVSLADRTNNTAANRTISLRVFFTF